MISRLESAADALRARYRSEDWFRMVKVEAEGIVLNVRGCPFREHRAVQGHPVLVRECEEFVP